MALSAMRTTSQTGRSRKNTGQRGPTAARISPSKIEPAAAASVTMFAVPPRSKMRRAIGRRCAWKAGFKSYSVIARSD